MRSAAPSLKSPQLEPESSLLTAALARDQKRWRAFVERYESTIRLAIREEAPPETSDDAIDDLLGDFWLFLLDDDLRRLRDFSGSDLGGWLALVAAQMTRNHFKRAARQPVMEPLRAVRDVAPPPPAFLDVEQVAARWGLDRKTVYAMIQRRELPSRRCGRLVKIPRKAVELWEQASVAPDRTRACR
jgi:excisionase family DNA binding protein